MPLTRVLLTGKPIIRKTLTGMLLTGKPLTGEPLTRKLLTGKPLTGLPPPAKHLTGKPLTGKPLRGTCAPGRFLTWMGGRRTLEVEDTPGVLRLGRRQLLFQLVNVVRVNQVVHVVIEPVGLKSISHNDQSYTPWLNQSDWNQSVKTISRTWSDSTSRAETNQSKESVVHAVTEPVGLKPISHNNQAYMKWLNRSDWNNLLWFTRFILALLFYLFSFIIYSDTIDIVMAPVSTSANSHPSVRNNYLLDHVYFTRVAFFWATCTFTKVRKMYTFQLSTEITWHESRLNDDEDSRKFQRVGANGVDPVCSPAIGWERAWQNRTRTGCGCSHTRTQTGSRQPPGGEHNNQTNK